MFYPLLLSSFAVLYSRPIRIKSSDLRHDSPGYHGYWAGNPIRVVGSATGEVAQEKQPCLIQRPALRSEEAHVEKLSPELC